MTTSNTEGSWRAVAVSEIGAAHVLAGMPCQDSSLCFAGDNLLVACVADGAGSARYSDEAARAAVAEFITVSRYLLARYESMPPVKIVEQAFKSAREVVSEEAESDLRDYATTLLGLVVRKDSLAAIQVGDGAVIVDGEVVTDSHEGEYINETRFITYPDVEPSIFSTTGYITRVAIVTDGLENLVLENNGYEKTPHGAFFQSMYEWLQRYEEPERTAQLSEFLKSERVRSRTPDDVTLFLAMR